MGRRRTPCAPPRTSGEAGHQGLGRWGLRGAALPPSSAPADPQAAGGPRGGGGSRALWPLRAWWGLTGRGRAAAARRSGARGPPGRPACERSRGRPRSHPAGPSPDRRGRCAAAAGRTLARRAGRSDAGARARVRREARARRAGAARPAGRASGPGATTPAPQARLPPPRAAMGLGEWGRPAAYKAPRRGPRGDSASHPGSGDSGLREWRSRLGGIQMTRSAGVSPSRGPHCMPGTVLALFHTRLL